MYSRACVVVYILSLICHDHMITYLDFIITATLVLCVTTLYLSMALCGYLSSHLAPTEAIISVNKHY